MSNATFKINSNTTGTVERLLKEANNYRDKNIYVGVIDKKSRKEREGEEIVDKKLTNAQIALWNEFGTQDDGGFIPERSFIRSTLYQNKRKYAHLRGQLAKKFVRGEIDKNRLMNTLGIKAVGDIKQTIRDLRDPSNAASTIKRKKSDNPLIDTGQMRNSVSYVIATEKELLS